jgi:probable rRNA maturation factor
MLKIHVTNEQSLVRVNTRRVRDGVRRTLEWERIADADVSVAVVDDAAIHALNRNYLKHDYPTDVLSFSLGEKQAGRGRRRQFIEGEVVVSAETAARRAADFGWHHTWELLLYVVHGTLHLCGFDDATPAGRRRMRTQEQTILRNWGLTVSYVSGLPPPRPEDD